MPAAKRLPAPLGLLRIADDRVHGAADIPIFGQESVSLSRASNWTSAYGPGTPAVHKWAGTAPLSFNFLFTVTAGIHCETREQLWRYVKTAHAMVAHVARDTVMEAPPRAHLIMGQMVNSYGVVTEITVNGKPPWAVRTESLPTVAEFQGSFLAMPGYANGIVEVQSTLRDLGAQSIIDNGYSL